MLGDVIVVALLASLALNFILLTFLCCSSTAKPKESAKPSTHMPGKNVAEAAATSEAVSTIVYFDRSEVYHKPQCGHVTKVKSGKPKELRPCKNCFTCSQLRPV